MKISVEREINVALCGFCGQIAQYREAPLHQIFLQAIIDQPGVTLSKLVKLFGLPAPACRQILRPLETAGLVTQRLTTGRLTLMEHLVARPHQDLGLLAPASFNEDPGLFAAKDNLPAGPLPVDLLEGDWLGLVTTEPFAGQRLLGVMPASRFYFNPQSVEAMPAFASLKGQAFTAVGSYDYQQEGRSDAHAKGSFRQGMLTSVNLEAIAFLDNLPGIISQDAQGSTLMLRHQEAGLSIDLKLHSPEVRPDLETLGLQAIRRHNGRTGEKYGTEPVLRKTFAAMSNAEKQTGRGAIYEEMGELRVKIDDLRVLPADQPSYEAWVGYGFEHRLQGYAELAQLTKHLQDSIAFVDAQGFLKPKLPQLIARLGGKSKMFATALADWPDVSS